MQRRGSWLPVWLILAGLTLLPVEAAEAAPRAVPIAIHPEGLLAKQPILVSGLFAHLQERLRPEGTALELRNAKTADPGVLHLHAGLGPAPGKTGHRLQLLGGFIPPRATTLDYALNWTFHPALLNGKPVPAAFSLTMPFRLR